MPLYRIEGNKINQLRAAAFRSERELQRLFEANLETLLGVRFLQSEFTTGDRQRGRIDTLGIDQDGTPTIIEYKKLSKDNVINQGLYYLDWLVDHKGDFTLAAQEMFGADIMIDWSNPRLILIAEEFTKYDKYAVNRIGANIELWTYRLYAEGTLYLEQIFVPDIAKKKRKEAVTKEVSGDDVVYDLDWHLEGKPDEIRELVDILRVRILGLGETDEVVENVTKTYIGFKHGKNFCEIQPLKGDIKLWMDISPLELDDPRELGRDVTKIGHHGTGDVEVRVKHTGDIDYIMTLVRQAYLLTV